MKEHKKRANSQLTAGGHYRYAAYPGHSSVKILKIKTIDYKKYKYVIFRIGYMPR